MPFVNLVLSDGQVFIGRCLKENPMVSGEIVFSTSSLGYTEILTDPSFYGQIVVLANPEIGNYGVNLDDIQSENITINGLVVRQLSLSFSSYRSHLTLRDWLLRQGIPVIFNVDTRAIISHIRDKGTMMASISCDQSIISILRHTEHLSSINNKRLTLCVSVPKPIKVVFGSGYHIVILDFGVKKSIIKNLAHLGASVTLLPCDSSVEEIFEYKPDGLLLSNGPGDPKLESQAIDTVSSILGKIPIFGICLGHQILALALGFDTYKLPFGHRGSNQAVIDKYGIKTTAQNHGFAAFLLSDDPVSMCSNVSDNTNEGLFIPDKFALSVQFHPEGAPGPRDAILYFKQFFDLIDSFKSNSSWAKACSASHID
jgi:carbamoyl-phosphate synthase small subunit